ncbi:hypothetical protein Xcel_3172 [Xylanimonas cellulosilytica DSM 15894]|uniref:Peptidase S1 and S6 chymotrypsin/Hap n=1 Tax=Xylanimonas cellulosilytica (strain DSM 15894 / JCM 12276 / CECT 5975 / KCTC 9989 / LMG 20990 / NBRC 107835 / XIL07) TaxID=446471 RepID=D1C0G9_XYLCX|nr:hypothetical protein [Xylanimonas cellulosilytica]ACZ32172.1 hypothetical protein Xcel_3172 [Xylanimonas cellulosilytica DSM 15894]
MITRRIAATAALSALLVSGLAAASYGSDSDQARIKAPAGDHVAIGSGTGNDRADDLGLLGLPPVPEEMSRLASDLMETYGDDARFASAEVTRDRSQLIVHWHGAMSNALAETLNTAPMVPVVVEQTPYLPGDVRAAAEQLAQDPRVAMVAVAPDASSLTVALSPGISSQQSARGSITADVDFPVTFETNAPVAATTRQNDINYHLGGARIALFDDPWIRAECTTAFAVVEPDTGTQGMLTAAHCGGVGSVWITSDGTFAYSYGPITERSTSVDGAVIASGWSQPYVWTGSWDSNTYAPVHGQRSPYVGQEICYSGSFSGTSCANVVEAISVNYNLGGDLTSLTAGFRTEHPDGLPVAGNGDSGGAAYEITAAAGGAQRKAVGIISAIPVDSGTTCNGVPGGDSNGRRCSSIVYSASVTALGAELGWAVQAAS